MLLTPAGYPANGMDRIMLLAIWANYLQENSNGGIIIAGIGKPTFPINIFAAKIAENYWKDFFLKSKKERSLVNSSKNQVFSHSLNSAIGYGDPQGDVEARIKMASGLTRWYSNAHPIKINAGHILFTIGGAGALRVIFNFFNKKYPQSKIITAFPYYSLYAGLWGEDNFQPIHVMNNPGYRLTAKSFHDSLEQASRLPGGKSQISAFLMCDPNNPLGTMIDKHELSEIAKILKANSHLFIILDEAYAEMSYEPNKHLSFLSIDPDLQDRIILIRSATKALSAAGERMGVIVTSNSYLMGEFIQENINLCGHTPRSLQHAFAGAMDKLDESELAALKNYYKPKVDYVWNRLNEMGAAMPDKDYRIEGTFYVLGNFEDLLGMDLPVATKKVLNKTGEIKTDEDIVYYLLFKHQVMVAPISYFGIRNKAYLRITCSCDEMLLKQLMDRLEICLKEARKIKQEKILNLLNNALNELLLLDLRKYNAIHLKMNTLLRTQGPLEKSTALNLKDSNLLLSKLLLASQRFLFGLSEKRRLETIIKLQSHCRVFLAKKHIISLQKEMDKKWFFFINSLAPNSINAKTYLCNMPRSERTGITLWKEYLKNPNTAKGMEMRNISAINRK
jgi:aspartate/methionine/tyrosine aminotransferase